MPKNSLYISKYDSFIFRQNKQPGNYIFYLLNGVSTINKNEKILY